MKHLFFLLLILSASTSFSQEICNNGIDDDGDGLIDLNDSVECACNYVFPNIIPNPSFEQMDCCPSTYSQMSCASGWIQASDATSDYFNTCGIASLSNYSLPISPPAGNGYVGFFDGPVAIFGGNYKEYIGSCLINQMLAGSNYNLSFQLGFTMSNNNIPSLSPFDVSIYGNTDCGSLPFSGIDCPTSPTTLPATWILLGTVSVSGAMTWTSANLSFTPPVNINAIAVGPSCAPQPNLSYYYLDDLKLVSALPLPLTLQIISDSAFCTGNKVLTAIPNIIGNYTFQWYQNGIAIVGATADTLAVSGSLVTDFQAVITDSIGRCAISNVYTTINTSAYSDINITTDSFFCQGSNVILKANAGFSSYNWSNNVSLDSIITNQIGWYWVEGIDGNGCVRRDSIFLQNYPQPVLSLDSIKRGCKNGESVLFLLANQGTPSYQYAMNNQSFQNNGGIFSSLSDGNYLIKVQDANGCQDSFTVNISRNPEMIIDFIEKQNTYCGLDNGMIAANVSGGTPAYSYEWNSPIPQSTSTANNLFAGTYTFTVTMLKVA